MLTLTFIENVIYLISNHCKLLIRNLMYIQQMIMYDIQFRVDFSHLWIKTKDKETNLTDSR